MTPTTTPTLEKPIAVPRGPAGPGETGRDGDAWRPGRDGDHAATPVTPATVAVWLVVATVTILFAAFTSTYLARRATADWKPVPMPRALWVSTAVLAASSAALEWARTGSRRGRPDQLRLGLAVTTALGLGFLTSQLVAWRQLVAAGIYLSSNPHSSFFFLLTGAHGLHLTGGLLVLFYAAWKVRRLAVARASSVVDPTATYWHFLGVLWLYLFILLFGI